MASNTAWWRSAAIYQLYPRSFADGNGDGIGDLAGARAHLTYLAGLGVDAIWFNPWYPSPMADAGYDISDYRDVDPVFGTLAGADALISEAHTLGLRIIVDVVPNHGSDQHPWFREALTSPPGSPQRARFWFRPGRGADGELPPNGWQSLFGGPAWTRAGEGGEWYLHLFAPGQPDFNWSNADVRREFIDVLRFWFDRGADGVRIDSGALLAKDPSLPEVGPDTPPGPAHPYVDRDEVHEIYRSWRQVADEYPARVLVGEIWIPDAARLARYIGPGELHTVFNFPYLGCPWDAAALRRVIGATLELHDRAGAPATWVLSNHDVDRVVSRYGRVDSSFDLARRAYYHGLPVDLALGTRRARAASLLSMALPGSVYVYQGEELGLWEVQDIPDELRQDPMWRRSGGTDPGRDGSRVPLPWSGPEPPFGFSPPGAVAQPWLPQPKEWRELTVTAQDGAEGSMLSLYRAALRIRRAEPALRDAPFTWLPSPDGVIAFERLVPGGAAGPSPIQSAAGSEAQPAWPAPTQLSLTQPAPAPVITARGAEERGGVRCVTNLSGEPVPLPEHGGVILASGPLTSGGLLPPDTSVWLRAVP